MIIKTDKIVIYPSQYFYSLPYINKDDFTSLNNFIEKDSFAVHLWNESWSEPNEFQYFRKRKYWKGFKKAVQRVRRNRQVKFKYLQKILSAIKESLTKRTWNI